MLSQHMRNKYVATGRIALEFFGDVTLQAIGPAGVENLMRFILLLPKNHGKKP